jgi:hypothetical protein
MWSRSLRAPSETSPDPSRVHGVPRQRDGEPPSTARAKGRVVVTRMVGLARMRTMSDEPVAPDQAATAEGYTSETTVDGIPRLKRRQPRSVRKLSLDLVRW